MDPNSSLHHDEEDDKSKRDSTLPNRNGTRHKGKPIITYNAQGVPIGDMASKLSTFEGNVARSMIPISYASWRAVSAETKEELWQYVMANFVVDPKSRKQILQSIGTKWRNYKHALYRDHIQVHINDPDADKKLLNPPPDCPSIEESDWKVFVSQRVLNAWQEISKKAKAVRAKNIYNHHLSRKGYAKLQRELMEKSGKTEEEINRAVLWKKAREKKSGGFDSHVQVVVDKIDELIESGGSGEVTCGTHDVLTEALGTQEQRGHVRGMGRFVKPHQYFYLPKTVKHLMEAEKKRFDQRFSKLEDEVNILKKGLNNASEAASCQMWGNEDFKDESLEEPTDNSCFLAVEHPSNLVAKGTVMSDTQEEEFVEVVVDIALQKEAEVPVPLEVEFVYTVEEAVGHVLSWPSYLVIRCSDLEKVVAKQKKKPAAKNKKQTEGNKRPREDAKEKKIDEKKVDDNEMGGVDEYGKEQLEKKEKEK